MNTDLQVALIAALVSLFVSAIGFTSTALNFRFQRKQIEKQIRSQLIEKLYSLRLEHYPQAFEFTDNIQRRPEPQRIIANDELMKISQDLYTWKSGVVSLIISADSLRAFYELRDALEMGYAEKERYSKEQTEKIFRCIADFRKSLRSDIGLLHKSQLKEIF